MEWALDLLQSNFVSMGKWKGCLLEAKDSNGVRLNFWLQKDYEYHEYCKLCSCKSNILFKVHVHSLSTPRKKSKGKFLISDFLPHRCIFQEKHFHYHPQIGRNQHQP